MKLVEKVQGIYQAFGRGDIPAILEQLAEDIDWDYGHGAIGVPWLERRHGRAGVAAFFEAARGLEFTRFAPTAFLEGPGMVAALVDVAARVAKTGRTIEEQDEIHLWTFDARGVVTRFRHGVDTHKHVLAYQD
jgi:ketosteroid isomerase-like protein